MDLKNLSDEALLKQTKAVVAKEKDATLLVLFHLREVERRQLFAWNHSSLFEYAVKELGYDSGSANLRISAMRLLRELPEYEEKFETGSLNLSLLAQAQAFIRKEGVEGTGAKREVLDAIEGKSTRDAQRELLGRAETPEKHLPERVRSASKTHSEVRLLVDDALLAQMKELQALLSHSHPGAGLRDVIQVAVSGEIARRNARTRAKESGTSAHDGAPLQTSSKAPSAAEVRRRVWQRDRGCCGFMVDAGTGRKCGSQFALELDHIVPKALGGSDAAENLRLRCRTHNRLEAVRVFGHDKMAEFVDAMR